MKKLLVTGASGFLGWNICMAAGHEWEISGTVFSNHISLPGVNIIKTDLTDFTALKDLFRKVHPNSVIHTAAAASPDYCQANPSESKKINQDAAIHIAGLCADSGIPLVFTSTDLVFDGTRAPYSEEDAVGPVNTYGEQKALAEEGVLKAYPDAAVCRMSLMFGDPGPAASSFFTAMLTALRDDSEIKLFEDEFRTPVSGRTAARGILLALEKVHGLLHLGGRDRVSRYEFGRLLMDAAGIQTGRFTRCRQRDVPTAAPRAADVSLDSAKAFSIGFRPMSLKKELEGIIQQNTR